MASTSNPLRAAVVGCGGAGENHASGYAQAGNAELVGVCDLDGERADDLASEYGVPAYYGLSDLLSAVDPDIVSIATPERHHVDPTITALEAGADVFCEKIMADSLAGGRQMASTAKSTGQTLGINYNYRHMPSFARIDAALVAGELGDVNLATMDVHPYGWHHALDLLAFLLGEPQSVCVTLDHEPMDVAEQFRLNGPLYVPSHAVSAIFRFTGGVTATVSASIHTDLNEHLIDLAVYGDKGRVRLTGMTPDDSTGTVAPGPLTDDLRTVDSITLAESFERSVEAFVNAVHSGEKPPTAAENGIRRLEQECAVVEAAETDGWMTL